MANDELRHGGMIFYRERWLCCGSAWVNGADRRPKSLMLFDREGVKVRCRIASSRATSTTMLFGIDRYGASITPMPWHLDRHGT
jgi:hypothetical protein